MLANFLIKIPAIFPSVTKNIDRHISGILKLYVKDTDHYVKNSKDFVEKSRDIKVALYPSVPPEEAIGIFYQELINDEDLEKKTKIKPDSIIKLDLRQNNILHFQWKNIPASRRLCNRSIDIRVCSGTFHAEI